MFSHLDSFSFSSCLCGCLIHLKYTPVHVFQFAFHFYKVPSHLILVDFFVLFGKCRTLTWYQKPSYYKTVFSGSVPAPLPVARLAVGTHLVGVYFFFLVFPFAKAGRSTNMFLFHFQSCTKGGTW